MSDDKSKPGFRIKFKQGDSSAPQKKDVRKRWIIAGIAGMGVILVLSSLLQGDKKPLPLADQSKKKAERMIDVTPKDFEAKNWQAQSQSDIQELRNQLKDLREQNKKMSDTLQKVDEKASREPVAKAPPEGIVAPPGSKEAQLVQDGIKSPIPPPLPPLKPGDKLNNSGGKNLDGKQGAGNNGSAIEKEEIKKPLLFPAPGAKANQKEGPLGKMGTAEDPVVAKVSYKKNPYAGFLPPGAFAPMATLHGLDAGTSSTNQSNPQPVLMRIQDYATLPGAAKFNLKSCFAIGAAYGDLSAERVYVRLSQLSCIDKKDKLVLSQEVAGYVVDSDGKLGLRGEVQDRQGSKLAKALLAGFAQGLGQALSGSQSTVVSSALGTTSSVGGSDALKASGLNGASQAASQLSQFYLKEAQALFPVITIDAARTGSVVFSKGVSLAWNEQDSKFTAEVKPE